MEKETKKNEYILEYDLIFVNVLSVILLVGMVALTVVLLQVLPSSLVGDLVGKLREGEFGNQFLSMYALFFVVMILWMVLHEIIHSIAYQVMGAKNENVVFGAALEKGVFYCKCKEYIDKKCIMVSLLSPFVLIGVVTYVLGFIFNSAWLILLSVINISGAAGDLMMFHFFLKQNKDIEFKELGYSSPFCLRTTDDLTNKKFVGIQSIKKVEDAKEIEEGPEKKVTITKASWVVLVFLVVLVGLMLLLQVFINKVDAEVNNLNQEEMDQIFEKQQRLVEDYLSDYDLSKIVWDFDSDGKIEEFPTLSFREENHDIFVDNGVNEKKLFRYHSFLKTYLYDLTGDGKRELVATYHCCNGMDYFNIKVYDIFNDRIYSFVIDTHHSYDMMLYSDDSNLKVLKVMYKEEKIYTGNLKLVLDENHEESGYLTIENEEEI